MAHLRPVAEELHFRIYLANLQLLQSGPVEGGGYDDEDDDENLTMMEVSDQSMDVKYAVDLDGMPVDLPDLEVEDDEIMPGPLSDNEPASKDYEGYQGNVSLVSPASVCLLSHRNFCSMAAT